MAPLTGYNSNVRHRGRMFHIQTEDSGEACPRIVTHLFADGGRIVKSLRAEYAEHLAEQDWPALVRELMKQQHKALFVALRSGELDDSIGFDEDAPPPTEAKPSLRSNEPLTLGAVSAPSLKPSLRSPSPAPQVKARSTPAVSPAEPEATTPSATPPSSGTRAYAAPRPCAIFSTGPASPSSSLFGTPGLGESSLDAAILDYLADVSGK
jgi:hypothetical protein